MLQQEFSLSDALAEVITGGEGGGGEGVEVTGGDIADSHTQYVFLVIEAMYNAAQGKVIKTHSSQTLRNLFQTRTTRQQRHAPGSIIMDRDLAPSTVTMRPSLAATTRSTRRWTKRLFCLNKS